MGWSAQHSNHRAPFSFLINVFFQQESGVLFHLNGRKEQKEKDLVSSQMEARKVRCEPDSTPTKERWS